MNTSFPSDVTVAFKLPLVTTVPFEEDDERCTAPQAEGEEEDAAVAGGGRSAEITSGESLKELPVRMALTCVIIVRHRNVRT